MITLLNNGFHQVLTLLLVFGTATACTHKEDMVIVGEVRDPDDDCASSLVEYEFRINVNSVPTGEWQKDWCAVMEGERGVTCFLSADNPQKNPYLISPGSSPTPKPPLLTLI